MEKWAGKLKTESPQCRCILLCTRTITLKQQGKLGEAVKLYAEVSKLQAPCSYISVPVNVKSIAVLPTFYRQLIFILHVQVCNSCIDLSGQALAECLLNKGNRSHNLEKAEALYLHLSHRRPKYIILFVLASSFRAFYLVIFLIGLNTKYWKFS